MQKKADKNFPPPIPARTGWPWNNDNVRPFEPLPEDGSWPKISIVTPSFNQDQYIEESIRSVLLQHYPNLEYIIIDGGSTDKTEDIIRKYEPWLTYWVSEKDEGQAHAINKGWQRCSGQIMAWLNSDDVYAPNTFYRVAKAWRDGGKPGMIYGDACSTDSHLRPYYKKDMSSYSLKDLLSGKNMPQPAVFISNELYARLGPLDESLYFTMDPDYFFRAWLAPEAETYRCISEVLAYSRRYAETKCQSGGTERIEENAQVLEKYWKEYMKSYHNSSVWRLRYAKGLAGLAQRYLDLGKFFMSLRMYKDALKWSPTITLIIVKNIIIYLFRKFRRDSPHTWQKAKKPI